MFVRAYNWWMHDPPVPALTLGQYTVIFMVLTLLFPRNSFHDQQPRFWSSWLIAISLHDTSSITMMYVPPLLNGPSEVVNRLYPVLILLVLNHPYIILYVFSFMGIFLQLLSILESPIISIPLLIMIIFKVSNLCCLGWYYALPILTMFWNMILITTFFFPSLSWYPRSPRQLVQEFVSVLFGIPLWYCPGGFG